MFITSELTSGYSNSEISIINQALHVLMTRMGYDKADKEQREEIEQAAADIVNSNLQWEGNTVESFCGDLVDDSKL